MLELNSINKNERNNQFVVELKLHQKRQKKGAVAPFFYSNQLVKRLLEPSLHQQL